MRFPEKTLVKNLNLDTTSGFKVILKTRKLHGNITYFTNLIRNYSNKIVKNAFH